MMSEDVEKEIDRLKIKRDELANKASMTKDFNRRDELEQEIAVIANQIKMLERLSTK
jgi:hypothetical protein